MPVSLILIYINNCLSIYCTVYFKLNKQFWLIPV